MKTYTEKEVLDIIRAIRTHPLIHNLADYKMIYESGHAATDEQVLKECIKIMKENGTISDR